MTSSVDLLTRRQALMRAAYLLGGTLSASTVAGVLAGCGVSPEAAKGEAWLPRTLSPEQNKMVLLMGEHILPETDTPGARAARVNEYIDAMLTDFYPVSARQEFLAGLERTDARARRVFGKSFLDSSPEQQLDLVRVLNRRAFQDFAEQAEGGSEEDPVVRKGDEAPGDVRTLPALDGDWDPEDTGRGSFFRKLKELVLVGYYTSEVGATEELAVNPMGIWRADIPYAEVGQTWA